MNGDTSCDTHLQGATLPGEDGGLAFCSENMSFSFCKLCAEDLGLSMNQLRSCSEVWYMSGVTFRRWLSINIP